MSAFPCLLNVNPKVRKTVGAEVNYGIRFTGWEDARQFLLQLAGEVSERLERLGTRGRCITLKLMLRAQNAPEETAKVFNNRQFIFSGQRSVIFFTYPKHKRLLGTTATWF